MIQRQIWKSFESVFGSSLIPLPQNCTGVAPTRTPPEFAGSASFEIGKTVKWKRKFYQEVCSYSDTASVLETRETLQDFHVRRPLAKRTTTVWRDDENETWNEPRSTEKLSFLL